MLDDIAISVLMRAKQIICNEYFPSENTVFCLLIVPERSMIFCNIFLIQNKIHVTSSPIYWSEAYFLQVCKM